MEEYSGKRYQAGVITGLGEYATLLNEGYLTLRLVELMELLAEKDVPSQSKYDVWFSIWERTVGFEKAFWDMALTLS